MSHAWNVSLFDLGGKPFARFDVSLGFLAEPLCLGSLAVPGPVFDDESRIVLEIGFVVSDQGDGKADGVGGDEAIQRIPLAITHCGVAVEIQYGHIGKQGEESCIYSIYMGFPVVNVLPKSA